MYELHFGIYLSILGTSNEGERSFSTIKRVKNYSKSTIGQKKLTNSALLCIEHDLMENLIIDLMENLIIDLMENDIIDCFATMKHREKNILIFEMNTNTIINLYYIFFL